MRFRSIPMTLAATTLAVAPLQAQTWQSVSPANGTAGYTNSNGYFNNVSDDNSASGDVCNIASLLTSTSPVCANQSPTGTLPLGTPATGLTTSNMRYLSNGNGGPVRFGLGVGTWDLTVFGRLAGAALPGQVNFYVFNGDNGGSFSLLNSGSLRITTNSFLLFGVTSFNPSGANQRTFFSSMQSVAATPVNTGVLNAPQQWAVFTDLANTTNNTGTWLRNTGVYWIGGEDNVCDRGAQATLCDQGGRFSDRDYNDYILRASAVPEPSTYALMATGLLAMGAIARRRRTQA